MLSVRCQRKSHPSNSCSFCFHYASALATTEVQMSRTACTAVTQSLSTPSNFRTFLSALWLLIFIRIPKTWWLNTMIHLSNLWNNHEPSTIFDRNVRVDDPLCCKSFPGFLSFNVWMWSSPTLPLHAICWPRRTNNCTFDLLWRMRLAEYFYRMSGQKITLVILPIFLLAFLP